MTWVTLGRCGDYQIVVGRKEWVFYGSDTHAESAAAIFTVIASCRLHKVEPQRYLEKFYVYCPTDQAIATLELAPKFWSATRAKLAASELDSPLSAFTAPAAFD